MKPRMFVGSSTESLSIAYALQELLPDVEVTVWSQGIFQLSSTILDDLLKTLDNTDFGVFVFTPDDLVTIREQQFQSARDNTVFEMGLFVGRLGKKRSFFIVPKDRKDFRLPSDLLGVTPAEYDPERRDKNLHAALGPAANKIRSAVTDSGIYSNSTQILTPRLVFLLRHIQATRERRSYNALRPDKILASFKDHEFSPLVQFDERSEKEREAWSMAAGYALKYLEAHKIIYTFTASGVFIEVTEYGKALLDSEESRDRFKYGYDQALLTDAY